MEKENSNGKRIITDEQRQAGRLLREQRKEENKKNQPNRLNDRKIELEREITSIQNSKFCSYIPLKVIHQTIDVDTGSYKDIGELYLKAAALQLDSNNFDIVIMHNYCDEYDRVVYSDMSIDGVRLYYKRKPTQIEIDNHFTEYLKNKDHFDKANVASINIIQSQIAKINLQLSELTQ